MTNMTDAQIEATCDAYWILREAHESLPAYEQSEAYTTLLNAIRHILT